MDLHVQCISVRKKKEKELDCVSGRFRPGIEPGGFEPYSNCLPLAVRSIHTT